MQPSFVTWGFAYRKNEAHDGGRRFAIRKMAGTQDACDHAANARQWVSGLFCPGPPSLPSQELRSKSRTAPPSSQPLQCWLDGWIWVSPLDLNEAAELHFPSLASPKGPGPWPQFPCAICSRPSGGLSTRRSEVFIRT